MKLHLILIALTLSGSRSFAHGEDKPGPNGGFIRMPGAFHTEVIKTGNSSIKVFLLDINWKDPVTTNSSVEAELVGQGRVTCTPKSGKFFVCNFANSADLSRKGELKLKSVRNEMTGSPVSYELPLRLQKIEDGHGHH